MGAPAVSCGEKLIELLSAYGIDTAFGIPGNHTVQLYRGLARSGIRHISPRHEQGAGFMADGYARATGRPAVCLLISGPGLGNAVTPFMQALADSIPMLVISAVNARDHMGLGEGRLHELPDQRALMSQCTRFSHTLMAVEQLPKVLARAFAVFQSSRPGPVHIEIPLDVIEADASQIPSQPWPQVKPACASPPALEELAQRLLSAEKPCLIAGGGAVGAATEIRALSGALSLPVVTTVNGKGILPKAHPLLVPGSPSLQCTRDLLAGSDLVLAVGTEFGETDYDMLFLGDLPALPWLARIDISAEQFSRNLPADLSLVGDSRTSLRALIKLLGNVEKDPSAAQQRVAACRSAHATESHVSAEIQRFFDCLQLSLPDLCLVGDSTLPTYFAVWQYESASPRRYFHSATGGGTLGYAIPAAIGAKRALGTQTPVVALIGDGAAQFTLMELAAAAQEALPVIVLLWNNHGYHEIKKGMLAADITPVGVDIAAPDFVMAAQALGCEATRVSDMDMLASALRSAETADKPTLIEVDESSFVSAGLGAWYE
ncbi:MAG: 5-guanidino-2-oxopentanoate decarboxylase [Congregibacter sp.]